MREGSLDESAVGDFFYLILLSLSSILTLVPYAFSWILHLLNTSNIVHVRLDTRAEIRVYVIVPF